MPRTQSKRWPRGKHVVTDKPMCLSMAEADQMIAASQAHDRLLSVFQKPPLGRRFPRR